MTDPASAAKAAVDTALDVTKLAFDSSIGCCTTWVYRVNCVKGGGTELCKKCGYHYCRYHFPVNNGGIQGGHVCN